MDLALRGLLIPKVVVYSEKLISMIQEIYKMCLLYCP